MNIEDLITLAANRCQMNPYDSKLVTSFYNQIFGGNGFTEKQAILAIKVLYRQKTKLNDIVGKDITPYLDNPVFRLGKRTINYNKRVSVIPSEDYGKAIKVEFPYNEQIVEKIRTNRSNFHHAAWDKDEKAWMFSLDEASIQFLSTLVDNDSFIPDEEFEIYASQVKEIQENLEKYVPLVTIVNNKPEFVNVSNYMPVLETDNVLESLFIARKYGVHTWDETVGENLRLKNVKKAVIDFLDQDPGTNFAINMEENELSDINDIVKYLKPCLFIIPGGSELDRTRRGIEFLKDIGVANDEISVLFRLPTETGEPFNKYVKNNFLNNPVTENTKAVFISGKIPKTILDANIKFECVVNFSIHSVHYTIREFVKNHHNIIHVLEKKPQRNLNLAFL